MQVSLALGYRSVFIYQKAAFYKSSLLVSIYDQSMITAIMVTRFYLIFLISSVKAGTTSNRSPTMP